MPGKVGHILKDDELGPTFLNYGQNVFEQAAVARTFQPLLAASLGERLTREACAENVVVGNAPKFDLTDVSVGFKPEVLTIEPLQTSVDLRGKNAFVAQSSQRDVKASQASE